MPSGSSCLLNVGVAINCLGRRVTSYITRDAKEIAKLLVIQTSTDFLKYA